MGLEPKIHHINQYKVIFIGMSFGTHTTPKNHFESLSIVKINCQHKILYLSMTKMKKNKMILMNLLTFVTIQIEIVKEENYKSSKLKN